MLRLLRRIEQAMEPVLTLDGVLGLAAGCAPWLVLPDLLLGGFIAADAPIVVWHCTFALWAFYVAGGAAYWAVRRNARVFGARVFGSVALLAHAIAGGYFLSRW